MELARLTIVYESTGFAECTQELKKIQSIGTASFLEIRKAAAGLADSVITEFRSMREAVNAGLEGMAGSARQSFAGINSAAASEFGQVMPGHAEDAEKRIKKSFKIWSEEGINKMQGLANQAGVTFGAIGAGIVGPLTFAAKASMDFETAFTGVRKTIDASEEEFAALKKEIVAMTRVTPFAAQDIARIAEVAGQLGVKKSNVMSFTKTILDLGVSSNLAGEEGATMLARFANITQMDQSQFSNLGSAIVALGNDGASSEKEIMEMGLRIAAAGELAGMTEGDILGLANALSSVGMEAEAGGTAISKTIRQMQAATFANTEETAKYEKVLAMTKAQQDAYAASMGISTKELKEQAKDIVNAAGELENFAEIAGMSADTFKVKFQQDAAGAVTAFLQGLKRIHESGGDLTVTLGRLGIEETRQIDALSRAALASDKFTQSIKLGNDALKENTALGEEAAKRYATAESKMKILWNAVTELSRALGDALMPTLLKLGGTLKEWLIDLTEWTNKHPELTERIVTTAAAIGGLNLALSGATFGFSGFLNIVELALGAATLYKVAAIGTGISSIGTAAGVATPLVGGLGIVGVATFGALGLAVLGTGTALYFLEQEFWKLKDSVMGLVQSGFALDAQTEKRVQQLERQGIEVDRVAMKEMSRSERIQYLTDLELNKGDAALRAYLNSVMTKEQADLLFNQAKNLRLNEEISMQEAAAIALSGIDDWSKEKLIRADAATTDAILRQLGIRTGAAKKSVTDTAQVESELTQVVNSGVGQRMTKREQMDRAWAESFRAQLAAQEASKSAVYQQVLADREHARYTEFMAQNVITFGNQTETVFLTVMPNATEKGLSETLNHIEKFQKEIEKKAKEIRETLQGAVDMNKRHSPSINDYAKIGFQDNLSIMQGFSNQAGTILGNIRSTFREAFDFTGPLMGVASSMPPVSTTEERNQAYSDAARSLNSIVNNNQSSQSNHYQGGNVSVGPVHIHAAPGASADQISDDFVDIVGQKLRHKAEQMMTGRYGLAPRF